MCCKLFSWSAVVFLMSVALTGCLNMPTPPAQITGTYQSGVEYEDCDYARLVNELDSLKRRETALVLAQEQREKTSQVQAFWWGFGQGDGIEASELATVRGKIEAVRRVMEKRGQEAARQKTPLQE